MLAPHPRLSCIMLARGQRRSLAQSVWYFLRQDYPARELIVVDDGDESVADMLPADPRVRHLRCEPGSAETSLRRGREVAEGEYLAHWDPQAWYSPNRLSAQIAFLHGSDLGATALSGLLHYQPLTGRVWQLDDTAGPRVAPHTLLWRAGSDPQPDAAGAQDGSSLAAVILPGSSTGQVNPLDPHWQRRGLAQLHALLGPDLRFHGTRDRTRTVSGGAAPGRPAPTAIAPVTVAGTFMVYDGYGSMAEYLAVGLARAGADVRVAPFRMDASAALPEMSALIAGPPPDPRGVVLAHAWWGEDLARYSSAGDLFVKTVWETSRLPEDWPDRLNRARAVIVPSDFAARVFRESGVRVPIEVAHEGIDPAVYPYVRRPEDRGPTTLVVGVLTERKNYRQAVQAWQLAFEDDPDARLILKARFQVERFAPDDRRITVVDRDETTRGILHWYRRADILLALGNEGFGLPLVEAMATGLPVVALDAEAQADVLAARDPAGEALALPVRVARWADVDSPVFGRAGVRAIPDVADAAAQLRWAAGHRREALELGRRASGWAHTHRNVWAMGPTVLEAIERHARTPQPLRQSHAVWVPLTGGADSLRRWAIRQHARSIARLAGRARLHEGVGAPAAAVAGAVAWRSPLLHAHVAPGLVDDDAVARELRAARSSGMAVLVTEHRRGGDDRAYPWEASVDVLVALDPGTASTLRALWPDKLVEVLPPGGPAWRRSSRPGDGRVIAVVTATPGGDLSRRMNVLAGRLHARWCLLPDATYATGQGEEAMAAWLNSAADVVLVDGLPDDGVTRLLERVAHASGVPVVPAGGGADAVAAALDDPALRRRLVQEARTRCAEVTWGRVADLHAALWRTVVP